ncbi:hypothetical protein CEXT_601721 [Caerostris extrusa]|uniref:Uncharacterized protein n=1 Tax=Caerostris extrusa TaxID=172846 RepID=A0AAV4MPD3_CAEEX|nr:hypothetical protein CEXT_601721 [Caerostris extrusa]
MTANELVWPLKVECLEKNISFPFFSVGRPAPGINYRPCSMQLPMLEELVRWLESRNEASPMVGAALHGEMVLWPITVAHFAGFMVTSYHLLKNIPLHNDFAFKIVYTLS